MMTALSSCPCRQVGARRRLGRGIAAAVVLAATSVLPLAGPALAGPDAALAGPAGG